MSTNLLPKKAKIKKPLTKVTKKRILVLCLTGLLMIISIIGMVLAILSANHIPWY